jgi:uncharacterized protein
MTKKSTENALIIFIKNPELGKVKTRIARTTGDEKALAIYSKLTEITRQNAQLLRGVHLHVFYSDFIDPTDAWPNQVFKKHVQTGEDLGERMSNAFSEILKKQKKAVIIGSDCPTLTTELLTSAFEKLDNHDFVVGPSTDGGYYLLGFGRKNINDFVFTNVDWSTDTVLPTTLKRIAENGKTTYLLPELTDIDEEKDWNAYQAMNG